MAGEISVRTVERALDILDCYATGATGQVKNGYTLTELSNAIHLSPSTTLRLLGALEKKHYLYRNPENLRYYLGFRLAQLSNIGFENMDFCQIAQPYLKMIVEQFNESAGLYALNGHRRVCVARFEGNRRLRSVIRIGDSYTLTRGAAGRVLLAYQPEEVVRLCRQEDPYTSRESLEDVRRQNYAISYGERDSGVISVAVPIFNTRGEAVAALFLTGASSHFDEGQVEAAKRLLLESGKKISQEMGYQGIYGSEEEL